MKKSLLVLSLAAILSGVAFAQAAARAATVTAVCKDGTPFSGATLKGACHGHGGVDKKARAGGQTNAAPAAPASSGAVPVAAAPAAPKAATPMAQAPGGGANQVWANDSSKVYHCPGDKYYGKTKHGEYMSEADAKAKGFHADHGKACKAA